MCELIHTEVEFKTVGFVALMECKKNEVRGHKPAGSVVATDSRNHFDEEHIVLGKV